MDAERLTDPGLLDRIELIESQALDQRAVRYEQVHDELLAELQRSDPDGGRPEQR